MRFGRRVLRVLVGGFRDELDRFSLDRMIEVREPQAAQRLLTVMLYGTSVLTALFAFLTFVTEVSATPQWWFVVPAVFLPLAVASHRRPPPARSPVWVAVPLLGTWVIAGLNIATGDGSAAAQVVMCLPVLFAGNHLHAPAAGTVTGSAIIANSATALVVLPSSSAITDVLYVSAILLAMQAVLVRAGRRSDLLVAQLRELATIDPLTGLVTRRAFSERARSALERRPVGDGTALIVLDIDRFKEINDTYGHVVGDDVLVHVSRLLASRTRVDSVVSRLGGDEIAVLLPRCTAEAARERAEDLVSAVRGNPVPVEGLDTPVRLTVSVGVAHSPPDGSTLRELYEAADDALYRAKRGGRDQVGLAASYDALAGAATLF